MTIPKFVLDARKLREAATEAPWSYDSDEDEIHSDVVAEKDGDPFHITFEAGVRRPRDSAFIAAAPTNQELLERALEMALRVLKEIEDKANWYASSHQGPEHEVHHALKVEVQFEAHEAIAQIHALGGEG